VKIGIIGGTGDIGEGIAMRLSSQYEVIIGSRDEEKACASSLCTIEELEKRGIHGCICEGVCNQEAVDRGDIIILAIPFRHLAATLEGLTGFEDRIVISPVNPLVRDDYFVYNPPVEGSAALLVRRLLPESAKVVAAFNNIAANNWKNLDIELGDSVAVCGDDPEAKATVMQLVRGISRLQAYDAGPLAVSPIVESITPLLLNIARFNKMRDVGIRFC
jgi:NADPH-dependent F420 reductase